MIRVGVAGWDYPDWAGPVYPPGPARGFDRLAYLARFVEVVEINSTFYRPVAPRIAASWLRRTRDLDTFRFTAKSHRSWTHERGRAIDADVEATLLGLEPLREAGRLGALLIQFPQSFHYTPDALDRLRRLAERLDGWPGVIELRHTSWADDTAREWLAARELGWCAVDQPRVGDSTLSLVPHVTSPVGYLRLHGRNVSNWFRPDAGRDARYDYQYGDTELDGLAAAAQELASKAAEVYVVQNNHFRGQALVNALQLRHRLSGVAPLAPARLVGAYPQLARETRVERAGLFE